MVLFVIVLRLVEVAVRGSAGRGGFCCGCARDNIAWDCLK